MNVLGGSSVKGGYRRPAGVFANADELAFRERISHRHTIADKYVNRTNNTGIKPSATLLRSLMNASSLLAPGWEETWPFALSGRIASPDSASSSFAWSSGTTARKKRNRSPPVNSWFNEATGGARV